MDVEEVLMDASDGSGSLADEGARAEDGAPRLLSLERSIANLSAGTSKLT